MNKNRLQYDVIVVGSGLAGCVIARMLAEKKEKKVLVIERREHIGGNIYESIDEHGIRIQRYGPHVFHTKNRKLYEFVSKYVKMEEYHLRCQAKIQDIVTPCPFNLKTIQQFYCENEANELIALLISRFSGEEVTVTELLSCEEEKIRQYGEFLFEKDYRPYTAKQWNLQPEQIDPSILKRVPVRLSYEESYFLNQYEGIPKGGFNALISGLLEHRNIQIQRNENAIKKMEFDEKSGTLQYEGKLVPIVFTGPIDELLGYRYGKLPYRSLEFKYHYYKKKDFQQAAIVYYPEHTAYTRTTEYTKIPDQSKEEITVVAYEYSLAAGKDEKQEREPYYPILTEENTSRYLKYREQADRYKNLYLCGRLAEYCYYNMDQVIERALSKYQEISFGD